MAGGCPLETSDKSAKCIGRDRFELALERQRDGVCLGTSAVCFFAAPPPHASADPGCRAVVLSFGPTTLSSPGLMHWLFSSGLPWRASEARAASAHFPQTLQAVYFLKAPS